MFVSPFRFVAFNNDVVVVNYTSNNISVMIGNPGGTFQAHVDYATCTGPFMVIVDDLNNDVLADLVVVNHGSQSISVFLGKRQRMG